MVDTNINEKILEKLKKIAKTPEEISMCKELLMLELRWHEIENPPVKRDFMGLLDNHFPFGKER